MYKREKNVTQKTKKQTIRHTRKKFQDKSSFQGHFQEIKKYSRTFPTLSKFPGHFKDHSATRRNYLPFNVPVIDHSLRDVA